jgi:ABC-type multidrug transport system permease subunit
MLQIEAVSCSKLTSLSTLHQMAENLSPDHHCCMNLVSHVLCVCVCAGVIWPIEGMPCVLRYISLGLPLTMATTALRCMLSRGWSIVEPDVYNGYIATIIWIVLFLSISLIVLKFKRG